MNMTVWAKRPQNFQLNQNMSAPEEKELLNFRHLPGRLRYPEAGVLLGFSVHDVATLVRLKLLRPLGDPAPNSVKYLATPELEKLAADPNWLDRATRAIARDWKRRNKGLTGKDSRAPSQVETA